MDDLSLVRFTTINFFSVILNSRPFQPISSLLIKLVESLIASEPEEDLVIKKRLKWIYENTHIKVNESLPIIELAVFKNLDKGLNREIDIGDKTFSLTQLYKYLDEVSKELTILVIGVAKKYNLDIPIGQIGLNKSNVQTISLD